MQNIILRYFKIQNIILRYFKYPNIQNFGKSISESEFKIQIISYRIFGYLDFQIRYKYLNTRNGNF